MKFVKYKKNSTFKVQALKILVKSAFVNKDFFAPDHCILMGSLSQVPFQQAPLHRKHLTVLS